jgi:hypothetical protein
MYGKWWYAQFLYWNTTRLNQKESQFDIELIWFNTYTFSDIIISNIPDTYDKNTIDIQTYEHSSHGLGLSNWLIRDKTITINWRILAENENELEKKIKRIKANLLTWNWTLYLKKRDWILQTKASVTKLEIPRESWTINSVNITIIFKILDPFFYSTKMNEIWYFNINKNLTTTLLYNEWTHNAKPSVFISFKEAQYTNQILLSINWKKLLINQRIKAWDSISINAEKLDVAKNGKYWIDWIWEFWELQTWENEINIEIDWEFNTEIFLKRRNTYI